MLKEGRSRKGIENAKAARDEPTAVHADRQDGGMDWCDKDRPLSATERDMRPVFALFLLRSRRSGYCKGGSMIKTLCCAATAMLALSTLARATEPGATRIPQAVVAVSGCWGGRGEVMGKPVTVTVDAKPIVQNAMMALDAESIAIADRNDRYSAHLLLGGAGDRPGSPTGGIVGFWADSFGGAFTATGESRADGFDITYQYPDDAFVNNWRLTGDRLSWQIVARDAKGIEKPFASYLLRKMACPASPRL
jgi:hypothetical protein